MKAENQQPGHRPGIAAAAAVTHLAAFAQGQETAGLDEIIVTARKVEENLQKTPIAITALTGSALEDRQVFSTDVLDQVVPNLQFANNAPLAGNNSSSQVFIRGIGQTDPTSTVDPGVGLYIDDVYIGNAVGASMALRDVANVQVLRGPQGTLFGRNTIGGAVLITTKDPGDEFGGEVRAELGADSLVDGVVALDVPLAETLQDAAVARHAPAGRLRDAPRRHGPRRHRHVLREVEGRVDAHGSPARHVHRRLHQVGRERQPAGVRGDQRRRHLSARREPRCRMPGTQRRRGAATGPARPAARADDGGRPLRQRLAGRRSVTGTTARCRCTARWTTSARR